MRSIGRYRLEEEVARGGMGAVYRATAPDGQPVALKLLLAGRQATSQQRERFQREVQAQLRLRHPNVVRLLDAGVEQGAPFLVQEWVAGESLAERLAGQGRLDPREAVELTRRLALALEHCHQQGVLHRDLKPGNVLLRASDGEPLLTDFGLAGDLAPEGASRADLSRTGVFLGTPGYWSPEQARGEREAFGPRTDVWGLGALLYALLTGQAPVATSSWAEALAALERPIAPPGALRPGLPAALDRVCARCLALDPAGRFASAGDVARALSALPRATAVTRGTRPLLIALPIAALAAVAALLALRLAGPRTAPSRPPTPNPAATVPEPAAEAARLTRDAVRALRRNDLTRTVELASAALTADPSGGGSTAHLLRAQALALNGNPAGASDAARRALLGASPAEEALARALLAIGADEVSQALEHLERARSLAPGDADVAFWRGTTRQRSRDLTGAIDDYTRALALDPDHVLALHNRGAARLDQGDLPGAIEDLERAVAVDPRDAQGHFTLGLARRTRGDLPGAQASLQRARELDPEDARAWAAGGLVRLQQGDPQGALPELDRALELAPEDANTWHHRGLARFDLGDLPGALADYGRALELDPRRPETLANRGSARQLSGDVPGAIADFERALSFFAPGSPEAAQVRAILAGLR